MQLPSSTREAATTTTTTRSFPFKSCLSVQPRVKHQRLPWWLSVHVRRVAAKSDSSARGGDASSWSFAAALAAACHHSAGRVIEEVVTRQEGSEGEVHEEYDAPQGPKPPHPGTRLAPLSEVAGPQGRLGRSSLPVCLGSSTVAVRDGVGSCT